jgi:peptide/nickel transport system permease protein
MIRNPQGILRASLRSKKVVFGLIVLVAIILFCFVGPLVYHTDQVHTNLSESLQAPSSSHLLGTDEAGYDQLGRLMEGGQTSLEVGVAAAVIATLFGLLWGAVAGYLGGLADTLMMRVVDGLLAIPALFILLLLASAFPPNTGMLIIVVAVVAWLGPARLVRAEALSLRERDYVRAVRVMGGGSSRAIVRHIVPNSAGTIVVNATFQVADAILLIAALSYLGLGIPPPAANWGSMLTNAVNHIYGGQWWLIYPPGVAIVITVVAFNFIGDGLRDRLDVRLHGR